jgi:hypothetical protein
MRTLAFTIVLVSGCVGGIGESTNDIPAEPAAGPTSVSPGSTGSAMPTAAGAAQPQAGEPVPSMPPAALPVATVGPPLIWPLVCDAKKGSATAPRLRRLTAVQYDRTLSSLGAKAPNAFQGSTSDAFFSTDVTGLGMTPYDVQMLVGSAEAAAHDFVVKAKPGRPCLGSGRPDRACLEPVITGFGARAFRRPLTSEETDRYVGAVLANQDSEGSDGALELAIAAMLSAPQFAFRWEVGAGAADAAGRVALTPYELASAISYTVTDGPPDAALAAAAQKGELASPDQVRTHVRRLLGPNADRPEALRFFREYLNYRNAESKILYGSRLGQYLAKDTDALVKLELSEHRSFVETLFTDTRGFVGNNSTWAYGPERSSSGPDVETMIQLPADQRAGILTQPAFLVSTWQGQPKVVARGHYVREMLMCQGIPPIPLPSIPPLPQTAGLTWREKLQVHSSNPQCAPCHMLMDPIGLALEQYGEYGNYRTANIQPYEKPDPGKPPKPIDASGVLTSAGAADGPFSGPVELARKLAALPEVKQCFIRQSFRYWLGRQESAADACSFKAAEDAYTQSKGDAVELFVAFLGSDSFLYRRATP